MKPTVWGVGYLDNHRLNGGFVIGRVTPPLFADTTLAAFGEPDLNAADPYLIIQVDGYVGYFKHRPSLQTQAAAYPLSGPSCCR